jgi:ankyrin repeat protein
MLIRKHDWHDYEGVKFLLVHGANPNLKRRHGLRAIAHAIARDNRLEIIELLLDHGADPTLTEDIGSAVAMAARKGRGDMLELFEQRAIRIELSDLDRMLAACARNDPVTVESITARQPDVLRQLQAVGGRVLAEFAGNGNTKGMGHLLNLGVDVNAVFKEGDGYWDVAPNSTALHVAAWRAQHNAVKLLIERGASINARDAKGRTPLGLAVRACVDSYWTGRRSPESVEALLAAGASTEDVPFPSGYAEVDKLIQAHRA